MPILASDQPYYHGTCLRNAVDALLQGRPLEPRRPAGRSSYTRSQTDRVYLSPSFGQAAEYAWMRTRSDWPDGFDEPLADLSHVFVFDLDGVAVEPEEDELGFAAKVALCRAAGLQHEWSVNDGFASALVHSPDVLERLTAAATGLLEGIAKERLLASPDRWTGRQKTQVGRALLGRIDSGLATDLIRLGISVSTDAVVRPRAAYVMRRLAMRREDVERIEIAPPAVDNNGSEAFEAPAPRP